MEQTEIIESPHGTYTLLLTTLDNSDVEVRLLHRETSEVVIQYTIDSQRTYLDEPGITEAFFSQDEQYLVINNFYYNPILVWDTRSGDLHLEIQDVDDVMSAEIEPDNTLRIEDGEGTWVRWDLAHRVKLD